MENIRHTETWRLCTQIRLIFTHAKRKQQKEIDANDTGISEQNLLRDCVTACIPQREIYDVLKTSDIFLSLFTGRSAYFRLKKSQNKVCVNPEEPFPRIVAKQWFT